MSLSWCIVFSWCCFHCKLIIPQQRGFVALPGFKSSLLYWGVFSQPHPFRRKAARNNRNLPQTYYRSVPQRREPSFVIKTGYHHRTKENRLNAFFTAPCTPSEEKRLGMIYILSIRTISPCGKGECSLFSKQAIKTELWKTDQAFFTDQHDSKTSHERKPIVGRFSKQPLDYLPSRFLKITNLLAT